MSAYLEPIKMAFIAFPIIAFFISLPLFVFQYHRYGVFLKWKGLIIYTFILYLIAAYFLVILPLPDREVVSKLTTPKYNLIPFTFMREFFKETVLNVWNIKTYVPALTQNVVIQPLFNIFLTLPLGIYLRYAFKKNIKQTLVLAFCLSLFFELTQLSGLYGIYSRPYRLFDVDDLFLNTLGGALGYTMTPLIATFFPTDEELKKKAVIERQQVTYMRRALAFIVDWLLFSFIFDFFFENKLVFIMLLIFYYIVVPFKVLNDQTVGMKLVNIKYTGVSSTEITCRQLIVRQVLMGMNFFIIFYLLGSALSATGTAPEAQLDRLLFIIMLLFGYTVIFYGSVLINMLIKKEQLFYEKIAKTRIVNTK